jgi:hypothetical protein
MFSNISRRRFMQSSSALSVGAATAIGAGFGLPAIQADEMQLAEGSVRFRDEIEPFVRLLETTPREKIVERVVEEIRRGLSYRELLTAVFLAGIRNVQPRPNVGFKFHTVLSVHATHLASLAASDSDRWLPLLWAVDNFKRAQSDDQSEGDWTMSAPANRKKMSAEKALSEFRNAMDNWDVEAADHYVTCAVESATIDQLFNAFAQFGSRDYRDIGHKAIYVAGAFRTLETIGYEHSEPILRSLAYALLCCGKDANPAKSDLPADRPGKNNWKKLRSAQPQWRYETTDENSTSDLLHQFRTMSADDACSEVLARMESGLHWRCVYDALFLASSELVVRQQAIVPLHAVTTTNAIHHLFRTVSDERLRQWLILQNTAFVCLLRDSARGRGELPDKWIDEIRTSESAPASVAEIFENVHRDTDLAASQILTAATDHQSVAEIMKAARNLVFVKGNDSHDYKFSSAVLEDFHAISPTWQNRYLAGCSYLLPGTSQPDTPLYARAKAALS